MSRIGMQPIEIPAGVTVEIKGRDVRVKGPKGELNFRCPREISAAQEGTSVQVKVAIENKNSGAYFGMVRAIINNMVQGVTSGFEKKLELVGVGYRAKVANPQTLNLTLGFSHPVDFKLPEGITAEVADQYITIKGFDRQLVGQVAANIRKLRKPEPYKGKGIRYSNEVVRRKQGKSGKV